MKLEYKKMEQKDIQSVIPLYIEYWNSTGDNWTPEIVYKRIWQVVGTPDSLCFVVTCNNKVIGFVMGRFETFYDLTAYNLVEILVAKDYQNKGLGTLIMNELERRVKKLGGAIIQLDSVNDEHHEHFYGKLGYRDVKNFKAKTKFLK